MRPRLLAAAACFVASLVFVGTIVGGSHRTLGRTGEDRPDEAVGPQVHAIYALPAGAPDGAYDTNGAIGSWLTAFNDWLQQTGGTKVRIDTFEGVPDVSFLPLRENEGSLGDTAVAYRAVYYDLADAGFVDPSKKYLVAIPAGLSPGPGMSAPCGLGGGSLAVLFITQCNGVSWAFVAGHEIFHTLGAVSECAAHSTHQGTYGHVTDPSDLMYPIVPSVGETPTLDAGHDDYWGPPGDSHLPAGCGPGADIASSPWLTSHLFFRLSVHSGPHGTASVRPDGEYADDCTPDCTNDGEAGARYELTASADPGYRFAGWTGGACSGEECTVTVTANTTLTANFAEQPSLRLSIRGKGGVTARDLETTCSATCSLAMPYGEATVLRATPAKGWRFAAWSGACTGTRATCRLSLTAAARTTASFTALPACAKGMRSSAKHPCRRA